MPASADAMPVFMPPGGPMEVMFSFDTTGSMSGCIAEVKTKVEEIITRLLADIPGLRISVMAHGDYCDTSTYVTKFVDFTNDQKKLTEFVKKVKGTGGGDWEECYELVLRQARTVLSWSPGTQRALVMIGDAIPHDTKYPQNKDKIDWKKETKALWEEMGVRIYAVQCQKNPSADSFYQHLAENTDGKWLQLDEFQNIVDLLMAICYREQGPDMYLAFEKEVRARRGQAIGRNLDTMLKSLRKPEDEEMDTSDTTPSTSKPRATGRKIVRAKRGGGGAKKTPAAKVTSPVAVATRRKRSATPAARPAKKVKKPEETKAERPKKAGATTKRRSTHSMRLRPRPRTVTGRNATVRKLVNNARTRAHKAAAAERRHREEITQADFSLGVLDWSPWKQAMAPGVCGKPNTWIPRRNDHIGVRNVSIFKHDTQKPALYEFAVQTLGGQKKYPVLTRTTAGFDSCHWDTKLLNTPRVEAQLDRVMKRGCRLYARRALFNEPVTVDSENVTTMDELRSVIHKTYDYPWQEHYDVPSRRYIHRNVMKDGVLISDNVRS